MREQKRTIRIRTVSDVERLKALAAAEARERFDVFRRMIRPGMLRGPFVEGLDCKLQEFDQDFAAGKRPKVAIMAPPQHGKSLEVTDFMSWFAGRNPDRKIIFASYSTELGIRTNLSLQRIMNSASYQNIFGRIQTGQPGWHCNTDLIEFAGYAGSFRNTTLAGQINGLELHLGVIDDPVKGRAEAYSRVIRDRTWDWFADDFLSRFAKDSALLMVMTRWHVDDPLGRFIERVPGVTLLRYPAIAEHDEEYRRAGEALFPELKPLDFLLERKQVLSQASWEAEYQQNPIIVGGGIFPIEKFRVLQFFDRNQIKRSVRYFDKAATERGGAYTAGVLMHQMLDRTYVIRHIARGQWGALEREQKIKKLVDADARLYRNYEVVVEQEPGSGGKESAEATIRMLAGRRANADRVTGSKEARAGPFAAQVQAGKVFIVVGDWVHAFLNEAESWPDGKYTDQIDAASGAFNRLSKGYGYDSTYKGFR
jgi:predicted phage terminase large subunit-like protein